KHWSMILSTVQSRETPEHPTNYCLGMASTGGTNQRRMFSRSLRGDSMLGRGLVSTRRSTRAEGSSIPLSAYDSKTYCRLVATYESGLKQTMRRTLADSDRPGKRSCTGLRHAEPSTFGEGTVKLRVGREQITGRIEAE